MLIIRNVAMEKSICTRLDYVPRVQVQLDCFIHVQRNIFSPEYLKQTLRMHWHIR